MRRFALTLTWVAIVFTACPVTISAPRLARASDEFISIVYPTDGDKLPYLKDQFVFGSTMPGSAVSVNGTPALIASTGGWIAFIPLQPGRFHLRAVADKNNQSTTFDWDVEVAQPAVTLPSNPARIDTTVPPAPKEDLTVQPGDTVKLFIKASTGAQVRATLGDAIAPLVEASAPNLIPSEQQRILGDMIASGESVGGLYQGELRVPTSARGNLKIQYTVQAPDGSNATITPEGTITVDPPGSYRVGYVVLEDHRKNLDARPYGVVESEPDGGWLFFPPAHTPFKVTGSDGSFWRVQIGASQEAWMSKGSLQLAPLGAPAPHATVGGVVVRNAQKSGNVVLHLSQRVPYSIEESTGTPSLRVHFYGASASTDFIRYADDKSNIKEIRWEQLPDEDVLVTINLRQQSLWGYHAGFSGNDLELVIKKPPKLEPAPAPAVSGLLVVIDPGHSPDAGAVGPLGTLERDVNLGIAKALVTRLEHLGARAVLTRSSNIPLGLYDRTGLAQRLNADILISVHNNALPDGIDPFTHHGFSVYYYQPQSLELARAIHAAYQRHIRIPDYGLYYDNLALARPTEEPAVLTESAFIMWPPEEALLIDPSFQEKLASTMAQGINDWVSSMRARETYKS